MCEYCEKEKPLCNALLSDARLKTIEDNFGKYKVSTLVINYSTYISINYCPMCGRKLGE